MKRPSWQDVLRGRRHLYGMFPEEETEVARECFCVGMLAGLLAGVLWAAVVL